MSTASSRMATDDTLLSPSNAAVLIIDYQPLQVASVMSRDKRQLVANVVSLARTALLFKVPVVLSTVNVATGFNKPMIEPLATLFGEAKPIDRTSINAWEDATLATAVRATGRRKLIMAALWTEVCLTLPALDAIREGFDVYPVVDAVGGTSREAHDAGITRLVQAGARPTTCVQLMCELQRDWSRTETAGRFAALLGGMQGQ